MAAGQWKIETQIEKNFKMEREVQARRIKCFPTEGTGGEMSFGIFRFLILNVILTDPSGNKWEVNWSNYENKPFTAPNCGKFKVKFPDFIAEISPRVKVRNGRDVDQWWNKQKTVVKGETQEFLVHQQFYDWMTKRAGEEIAGRVMGEIFARVVEIAEKKAAKISKETAAA